MCHRLSDFVHGTGFIGVLVLLGALGKLGQLPLEVSVALAHRFEVLLLRIEFRFFLPHLAADLRELFVALVVCFIGSRAFALLKATKSGWAEI